MGEEGLPQYLVWWRKSMRHRCAHTYNKPKVAGSPPQIPLQFFWLQRQDILPPRAFLPFFDTEVLVGDASMTMQIMIEVPDTLGRQLHNLRERLPEILERGLREVSTEQAAEFQDENAILEVLASQPTPEQVLALRPITGVANAPEHPLRAAEK